MDVLFVVSDFKEDIMGFTGAGFTRREVFEDTRTAEEIAQDQVNTQEYLRRQVNDYYDQADAERRSR